MGSAQVICADKHPWRAGDVRAAARHSGRGRKCQGSCIAVRRPASVSGGAAGNGPSARARTRHGPSVPGHKTIARIGASIGEPTQTNASATATDPGSGNVIAGSVRAHRVLPSFQRWTRRYRVRPCCQRLTGWSRRDRGVCKDRHVDGGNHFGINTVGGDGWGLQREDAIGAVERCC